MKNKKCPHWQNCELYDPNGVTCNKDEGFYGSGYPSCVREKQKGNKSKIAICLGTKAELIKCMPLMDSLQKQKINYTFIHTGQHKLGEACKEFRIKKPDYVLSKEPTKSTKFWSKINGNSIFWCFSMIFKIKKLIKKLNLLMLSTTEIQ